MSDTFGIHHAVEAKQVLAWLRTQFIEEISLVCAVIAATVESLDIVCNGSWRTIGNIVLSISVSEISGALRLSNYST